MRFFLDTEFMEDGKTIGLISIGIVAEDGREFYAETSDVDLDQANDWVKQNVLPQLWHRNKVEGNKFNRDGGNGGWWTRKEIRSGILRFVGDDKPEFWGYYADYDWVVFCWLFGKMIDLPKGWPMYCRDIKQLCDSVGNPKLPSQTGEHHALEDARWNKRAYEFLVPADLSNEQLDAVAEHLRATGQAKE